MCFDVIREGSGLRFSIVKEPRAKLPHTRHGAGGHCFFYWTEVGERHYTGIDLIRDTYEKVDLIRKHLLMA